MKCIGCGAILQNTDITKDGYTPIINNKLCQRCFKIKNYGENILSIKKIDSATVIQKINQKAQFIIYLTDFLSISEEIINTYKSFMKPKIFLITKADVIPKNINKEQLKNNIKKVYNLKEELIFISTINNENINYLRSIIESKKEVFIAGYTNAGKSSLINKLTGSNITTSKNANTTLNFMKIKMQESIIYDTPGIVFHNFIDGYVTKKILKPLTYQLKSKYALKINDFLFNFDIDNNLVLFLNNSVNVMKRKNIFSFPNTLKVKENSDLIIKGLGFIYIKKESILKTNIDLNLIEIRKSIIGDHNE